MGLGYLQGFFTRLLFPIQHLLVREGRKYRKKFFFGELKEYWPVSFRMHLFDFDYPLASAFFH